ncbi:hypothetical protein [Micromonospora carbonacea]|uniref:Pycsar effector protein domain-containing protein n=1 Tax=Micromonospora carbonacea TaxID=47853 RepID=A0A1C5AAG6_9ACTN|nr:hypothetical protein [Micromonospora carbonacea]SCF42200.1 hypothetical protein GA0070563_11250 [Micromonospora carbonacea]
MTAEQSAVCGRCHIMPAAALLCTVAAWLPRLDGGHGFAVYAGATAEDLPRLVAADQTNTVDRLTWTARRVYRKYQLIRAAGLLTGFAVVSAATVGGIALAVHLAG